jgi:hypothetical protein
VLAAALTLAVILALAGVLGGIGSGLREEHASMDSGSIVLRCLLRGYSNCSTAKKAGDDGGQSKRLCGIHQERNLSLVWAVRRMRWTLIDSHNRKLPDQLNASAHIMNWQGEAELQASVHT